MHGENDPNYVYSSQIILQWTFSSKFLWHVMSGLYNHIYYQNIGAMRGMINSFNIENTFVIYWSCCKGQGNLCWSYVGCLYLQKYISKIMWLYQEYLWNLWRIRYLAYLIQYLFVMVPHLMAHNWQKWKSIIPTCPCHEISCRIAVGLKTSNYT